MTDRPRRWSADGKLAVVTGASSGIGQCLAKQLVRRGCRVIVVARREERLADLARENQFFEENLIALAGDLTEPQTRQRIVDAICEERGHVDLLVNNAGVGAIGAFETASPERLRDVMEVNFFAPTELTRSLLPLLKASGDGVICNISSVLGHCAVPDKSEYCASKFAMHGWTDSLRAELQSQGLTVTLVSPSTTRSEFFNVLIDSEGASSKSVGSWSPDRVAAATIRAIERRRREVILSLGGKALVYADRLFPGLMAWILKRR
ncbi:SDR family NAD(P)-dependent oxidoreductase [Rhodopirellula sp. MGV]|uniref:SDR family NAD(P)-dependent oxidoreductase n=1 Tax=Rhodopirellula sp. MGV TaxID=2023130 RepID=UPI000B95DEDC|nr:SDR family NAD(P)-dependent oxidoreductase [Rhodopirellula sp. MGV]OYP31092.1 glucose dehydrogenase [Rhodopirellula sp. MGV]PNY37464.1 KR domain-containing protein [Rhodopirellula baltica]